MVARNWTGASAKIAERRGAFSRRKAMAGRRKQYSSEFKVRVALEAIKGQKTANESASEYGVHPTQIAQGKKQALDERPTVLARPGSERAKSEEALIASLYQQSGQLKVEVDFLKKKAG